MNPARFKTLAAAAAALASQTALSPGAEAKIVPIIHDSTFRGIDGLDVLGIEYDVTFERVDGSPPTPEFASLKSADDASEVLGKELVRLERTYLESNPGSLLYVKGCHSPIDLFACNIVTPDKSP